MEKVYYLHFVSYLRRLLDDIDNFTFDLSANLGDVDLHDYSFNLTPLINVMEGKTLLLTDTDVGRPKGIDPTASPSEAAAEGGIP